MSCFRGSTPLVYQECSLERAKLHQLFGSNLISLFSEHVFDFGDALVHLVVDLMERGLNATMMLNKTVYELVSQFLTVF